MCLRILGFKEGKLYPSVFPNALSLLGSERGIQLQLTAQGSSAARTGRPGHTVVVVGDTSSLPDHSETYMTLLCFTIATHSSNLDSFNFFFLFSPRCCDCDSHWGLHMLGRSLPFGGDHTHLGMPAVLWAHGPEGEACGRPYSASLGVYYLCVCWNLCPYACLGGPSLGALNQK